MTRPPILLIIFNRYHTLEQLFKVLALVKPPRLYIAADGPRTKKPGEKELCDKTRELALSSISWPCEVKTFFQDANLGCGKAVSGAITWFFDHVDSGIILEDDCIPDPSFFDFASDLLSRYRENTQIMHISGNNPLGLANTANKSYFFTNLQFCWGWATWKRAWQNYQFSIDDSGPEIDKVLNKVFTTEAERRTWHNILTKMGSHAIDTWDYQWSYTIFKAQGLCVTPCVNLVSNIGFDGSGTHTFNLESNLANQKTYSIGQLVHPHLIKKNDRLTLKLNRKVHDVPASMAIRVLNKIKKIFGAAE